MADRRVEGRIRIGSWPQPDEYDYLRGMYGALAAYGISVLPDQVQLDAAFITRNRESLDGIHVHWPEWQWNAAPSFRAGLAVIRRHWELMTAARRLGLPVVWTAHNLAGHDRNTVLDRIGLAMWQRRADLVLCHDTRSYERVVARRWRSRATLLVRRGNYASVWPAPAPRADTRARLGAGPDTRLLLCFGVIRPYKGFDIAAQAVQQLPAQYHLLIAGRSADAGYVRALEGRQSERLAIAVGRFSNQELVDMLEACDCVLIPYRAITTSGVLMAAFTAHRGVVATRLPYFEDSLAFAPRAGVLCDPEPSALARAIEEFFSLPLTERSAAAASVAARHDWVDLVAPYGEWLREHAQPGLTAATS